MPSSKCPYMRNAIKRHGKKAFSFQIMATFPSEDEAYTEEIRLIAYFRSIGQRLYNIADGGNGIRAKGLYQHSDESKLKISQANKGLKRSEASKLLMSQNRKGKGLGNGRPLSEVHKSKISASKRGRKASAETRQKLSKSHKGYVHSEETKRKIGEAQRGKKISPEVRANVKAAAIARYAAKRKELSKLLIAGATQKQIESLGFRPRYARLIRKELGLPCLRQPKK